MFDLKLKCSNNLMCLVIYLMWLIIYLFLWSLTSLIAFDHHIEITFEHFFIKYIIILYCHFIIIGNFIQSYECNLIIPPANSVACLMKRLILSTQIQEDNRPIRNYIKLPQWRVNVVSLDLMIGCLNGNFRVYSVINLRFYAINVKKINSFFIELFTHWAKPSFNSISKRIFVYDECKKFIFILFERF